MKLKLKKSELQGLYVVFNTIVFQGKPSTMEIKLLQAVLKSIFVKLHKKIIDVQKVYSLTLTDPEALAFWVFFQRCPLDPSALPFEANLIRRISNDILQKHTK